MSEMNFQNQGRTMIEILGVLAIIGVLSITGIAAYNVALNKHRANQILNAGSLRAVTVSAKLQQGQEVSGLSETFTEENLPSGIAFSSEVMARPGQPTFSLTLMGLDAENPICLQMKGMVGQESIVKISDDCQTFTYNQDLSAGFSEQTESEEGNVSNISCSETSNTCVGCQSCNETLGKCQDDNSLCPSENGVPTTCTNGSCSCSNLGFSCNGICCAKGSVCTYDKTNRQPMCAEPVASGTCVTNADCADNQYCGLTRDGTDDYIPKNGKCCALPELKEWSFNGRTFWYSDDPLYCKGAFGWNRQNVCMAHGKKLATITSLGLAKGYSYDNCVAKKRYCYSYDMSTWEEVKTEIPEDALCKDLEWAEQTEKWDEQECEYCGYDCVEREGIGPVRQSFGRDGTFYLGTFSSDSGSGRLALTFTSNTERLMSTHWNDYSSSTMTLCE